jgi:hypothetical protein
LCSRSAADIDWRVAFRWEAFRPIFKIFFPCFMTVLSVELGVWSPAALEDGRSSNSKL